MRRLGTGQEPAPNGLADTMLEAYKTKRDFTRTREPGLSSPSPAKGNLRFVVQKHAARRLHYDFRLELDGVLKSWAVPKGPSLNPGEKRLAVLVEDHPLDYGTFEGVIGHDNYGAGQVVVWDTGTYSPDEAGRLDFDNREEAEVRMRRDLAKGKLSITLRGRKLRGSWTLVRTARSPTDWLLIKHKDEYADVDRDVLQEQKSVQSGLTIADLKSGHLPEPSLTSDGLAVMEKVRAFGETAPFPMRLKPMLARLADRPFSHAGWLFEPKLDGFRVLAFSREGKAELLSRNGQNLEMLFPRITSELEAQFEKDLVLDGEVVALDQEGRPDFGLLQRTANAKGSSSDAATIVYFPFDLLYVNGTSLKRVPLIERKKLLSLVLNPGEHVHHVEYVEGEGESFYQAVVNLGLEGMVAKRRNSLYEPGARSRSWLKVKAVQADDFVIGGYTKGTGARTSSFGALLLGHYDGGKLHYAGRVGSGFDNATLEELKGYLSRLKIKHSPFVQEPELTDPTNTWARPKLIARVKFANWTDDGRLRAPVFMGLRSDLNPKEVKRTTFEPVIGGDHAEGPPQSESLDSVVPILDQLLDSSESLTLELEGHRLSLTNLNKALWPATNGGSAVTKRDMIRYYIRLAHVLLPHLRDRPLTLTRYPDGISGESFYQKHWEHRLPEFVETVRLFSSHNEGDQEYLMANNLPTLIWLAQIANIELHPWLSRTVLQPDAEELGGTFTGSKKAIEGSVLNYPDFIVFDLDPYVYSGKEKPNEEPELNRRAFSKVTEVALALKDILDQLSLSSFLKTSGKTGLHIYVPVLRQYNYTVTRKACDIIGRFLMQHRPNDVTMEWTVSKRRGKIFFDHNQNSRGKNMASIYSLRPLPGAPVSTPVSWQELEDVYPTHLTIETVPDRVDKLGDLWADVFQQKHNLNRLLETA